MLYVVYIENINTVIIWNKKSENDDMFDPEVQKTRIAQYGKALYNRVLKFGMGKQECSVSKFQQMDEFAIRKLFDF